MVGGFKRGTFQLTLLFFILISLVLPSNIVTGEDDETIPLGTESWKLPEFHRIYVQELPTEEDPAQFETKLDRNYPTSAEPLGNLEFGIE